MTGNVSEANKGQITVLYFASLGDRLGVEQECLTISQPSTVDMLKLQLAERGELWREIIGDGSTRCAINHRLANASDAICDRDEIAFFPPVTGG